jgi:gamma-glutamyltranspeptidase/glutathione hydrolase
MAMSQQKAGTSRRGLTSRRGAVGAGDPLAVDAGLEALRAGGNAIDATIAAAFVAFVAEPNNAGIFGYGHLSAYLSGAGRFLTVDHSPRAPSAARADMYEIDAATPTEGNDWPSVIDDLNAAGPLAPAVPGAVSGLWSAHQEAGRLPWDQLLAPAIALADEGVEVTWALLLEIAARQDQIRSNPGLAAILMPNGRLPRARTPDDPGERVNQRELAATLRRLAAEGPDGLYHGSVAEAVARELAGAGGILTARDLAAYAPKVLTETPQEYRGLEYITATDTVGYGTLSILEHFPLAGYGPGSVGHYHLLAEAMGHAFVDGASYASDPDFSDDPIEALGGAEFGARRAAAIRLDRAAPRPIAPDAPWLEPGAPPGPLSGGGMHGTTQVVAADAEGNVVALITTIGGDFGAGMAVPGTGIILNNSMVNYDPRPGRSNSIAPGKMPFFAVPTLVAVRAGVPAYAAAGSGGYPILAGVINTFVGMVDHRLSVQDAIDQPRVHCQGDATFIDRRVDPQVRARLAELGHRLVVQETTPGELAFSRVSALSFAGGEIAVGSGPSWNTGAGVL